MVEVGIEVPLGGGNDNWKEVPRASGEIEILLDLDLPALQEYL